MFVTVYYTHKPGGLCKRLYLLCDALVESGQELTFFSLDPESHHLAERVTKHRIPFPLRARGGLIFWIFFTLWTPWYLAYALWGKHTRAFVFNPYYWLILVPSRALGGISHITTFFRSIGSRTYLARRAWLRMHISSALEQLAYRFSDAVVTQTKAMSDTLRGGGTTKHSHLHLLPNNASERIAEAKSRPNGPPYHCIIVGMFDEGKNLPIVINAFRFLAPELFQLKIVGDGPAVPSAKALVKNYELPHVTFAGWVSDTTAYFQSAHILIHPSFNEGMPNAVLEAFSHGLAVFTSSTPELVELVGDERLTFNPHQADNLLELLRLFAKSEDFRTKCSQISRNRRNLFNFNWAERARNTLLT
ncbi:MAG: glycosyltransferase family 4 protein [Bdellovibrionales bacterium]|nr:glycosyltransferase family 4 protein [Bdellovibrionales bacterium]